MSASNWGRALRARGVFSGIRPMAGTRPGRGRGRARPRNPKVPVRFPVGVALRGRGGAPDADRPAASPSLSLCEHPPGALGGLRRSDGWLAGPRAGPRASAACDSDRSGRAEGSPGWTAGPPVSAWHYVLDPWALAAVRPRQARRWSRRAARASASMGCQTRAGGERRGSPGRGLRGAPRGRG